MDARMLDVTTGIVTLVVFIMMLFFLPVLFDKLPGGAGMAYVVAIVVYILFMSGSGFLIREKIA
jgi:Ca2+/Na+ antiporter